MIDDQMLSDSPGNEGRDKARAMNYMVEVFLDKNKYVRRTRIHHVQSDQEVTWDNWDEARLLAFFKQRPELRFTKHQQAAKNTEPVQMEEVKTAEIMAEPDAASTPASETTESTGTKIGAVKSAKGVPHSRKATKNPQPDQIEEVKTAEIMAEPVAASTPASETTESTGIETGAVKSARGVPHLRKMEIIPRRFNFPSSQFDHKQAFKVRLYLDLAEMKLSEWGSLNYSVAVMVRRTSGGHGQKIIKDQGTITSNSNMTLNLKWPALPPGNYRISAAVTISSQDNNPTPEDQFTASLEGGLFQVY